MDLVSYGVYKYPNTTDYYYLRNGHGDVTYLTDEDGAITKTYEYDAFGNEEAPDSADTNPFRYAGEYYDTETGTYYLRARYYDPVIGRFTQEDPARHSTNWYLYCYCNPIRYIDPSGNIPAETLLDGASVFVSLAEFFHNPGLATFGYLLWDAGALFLPYVPGSYTAKGISLLGKSDNIVDIVKGINNADNVADAAKVFRASSKSVVGSYKDIKKTVTSLGITDMEVHHLVEQRFAKNLGFTNTNNMLSVALDKDTHRKITSELRGWSAMFTT